MKKQFVMREKCFPVIRLGKDVYLFQYPIKPGFDYGIVVEQMDNSLIEDIQFYKPKYNSNLVKMGIRQKFCLINLVLLNKRFVESKLKIIRV